MTCPKCTMCSSKKFKRIFFYKSKRIIWILDGRIVNFGAFHKLKSDWKLLILKADHRLKTPELGLIFP